MVVRINREIAHPAHILWSTVALLHCCFLARASQPHGDEYHTKWLLLDTDLDLMGSEEVMMNLGYGSWIDDPTITIGLDRLKAANPTGAIAFGDVDNDGGECARICM